MLWNDNEFGRAEKAEANKEGGWGSYSFCQRQHRCRHWSQLPKWGGDATALLKGGGGAQQAPPRGGEELSYRCVRERRYTSLNKGGDKALMTRRGRGRGKVLKGGVREGGRQVRRREGRPRPVFPLYCVLNMLFCLYDMARSRLPWQPVVKGTIGSFSLKPQAIKHVDIHTHSSKIPFWAHPDVCFFFRF